MEGNGEPKLGPRDSHDGPPLDPKLREETDAIIGRPNGDRPDELKKLRTGRREYDFDPESGELSRRDDVFTEGEALPSQVESQGQLHIDHERAIRKLEQQLDSPEGLLSDFTVDHVRRHLTPLLVELREHVRKQQPLAKDSSLHQPLDAWTEKLGQAMGLLVEALDRRRQLGWLNHLNCGLPLAALFDELVQLRDEVAALPDREPVDSSSQNDLPPVAERLRKTWDTTWWYLTQPIGRRLPPPKTALEYVQTVVQAAKGLPRKLLEAVIHHPELERFAKRVEGISTIKRGSDADGRSWVELSLGQLELLHGQSLAKINSVARSLGLDELAEDDPQLGSGRRVSDDPTVLYDSHLHLKFRIPERKESTEWIDRIVAKEQEALEQFFGWPFDLEQFRRTLERYGKEKIEAWAKLGLEPHFLPARTLTKDTELPGWKERPEQWYWDQLSNGQLLLPNQQGNLEVVREARLPGKTLLVDTRCKPDYAEGAQLWADDEDFCGSIVAQLRKQGALKRREGIPESSRFGVTAAEWEEHVRPAVAKRLGLRIDQMVSETALEANVIPQLFRGMARAKDGTTTTWVWYEERFKSAAHRLDGGRSVYGGLADVSYSHASDWSSSLAFRPLGVLD